MSRGKKRKPDFYFTNTEENALINYINSESKRERDIIFNKYLYEPLKKMVAIILRRYPIHMGNFSIEELESDGLVHLVERMTRFNPDMITKSGKKTKAFSYCQTIVRNYYRDHSRNTYKEKKSLLNFDDFDENINDMPEYSYELNDDEKDDSEKIIDIIISSIRNRISTDKTLKKNEIIIGEAVINILKNWDILFLDENMNDYIKYDNDNYKKDKKISNNYAKNRIFLFLKEQTNFTTKDIRNSLKVFKELYYLDKNEYYNSDEDENDFF